MKRLKILRRWFARKFGFARLLCLALLVGFAGLRVADPAPVQELRLRTFDTFQLLEPRDKTVRPVTIVDIDDKSLAKLGQWPWPRTRIADMIINLTNLGAVAIAFDVVFSEPDRLNPDAGRRHDALSGRGDPGEAARAAEQRPDPRRRHQALARGARRNRAARRRGRNSTSRFR